MLQNRDKCVSTFLALTLFKLCLVSQATAMSEGTNRHIKDIFIGSCWYYTDYIRQSSGLNVQINCTDLWETFSTAWMYKHPCNVTMADYEPFVKAATIPGEVTTDKAVFWEGAYLLAHDYSSRRRRYIASADTLWGYLGQHMYPWCGKTTEPGVNYDECPVEEECPMFQGVYGGLWSAVSKALAEVSTGVIQVILNGTAGEKVAFNETSYFNLYELPNFPKANITRFQLMVFHDVGKPHKETCNNGSLLLLKRRLTELGFKHNCVDDAGALKHLICLDSADASECQFADDVLKSTSAASYDRRAGGYQILVCCGTLVLTLYLFLRAKMRI